MEFTLKNSFALTAVVGLLLTSSFALAHSKANLTIKEASNSAHASFYIEQPEMPLEVIVDFGYYRTKTKSDGSVPMPPIPPMPPTIPMPIDDGAINADGSSPDGNFPYIPADSEHAYLILQINTALPPPHPMPDPMPKPMPVPDPGFDPANPIPPTEMNVNQPMMDGAISNSDGNLPIDPNMPPHPPTEPPTEPLMPPMYEVLYFELTPEQMTMTKTSTTVEINSCQQDSPSMLMENCGMLTIHWENNDMNSNEDNIKSVSKTMNGMFGESMTINRKHKLKYSSATAQAVTMGHLLDSNYAGRSSAKSVQKFYFGTQGN